MNFSYREALTFVLQTDHTLVSRMYWQMACLYVCMVAIYMSMISQKNSGHQEVQLAFKSVSKRLIK